jgi:hypothetical protein
MYKLFYNPFIRNSELKFVCRIFFLSIARAIFSSLSTTKSEISPREFKLINEKKKKI